MPADLLRTFRAFAYNNAWANHRLLKACAGLDQAEFDRRAHRLLSEPAVQRSNHIYVVELFYVDAHGGRRLGPRAGSIRCRASSSPRCEACAGRIDRRLIATAKR